jgi:hypothetical protein
MSALEGPYDALIPDDPEHALAMIRGLLTLGSEDWADLLREDRELMEKLSDRAYTTLHGHLP